MSINDPSKIHNILYLYLSNNYRRISWIPGHVRINLYHRKYILLNTFFSLLNIYFLYNFNLNFLFILFIKKKDIYTNNIILYLKVYNLISMNLILCKFSKILYPKTFFLHNSFLIFPSRSPEAVILYTYTHMISSPWERIPLLWKAQGEHDK